MKLRTQLLTLSLATLLVPWFGWKLLQELEQFLRLAQEGALLAAAQTAAQAMPSEYQAQMLFDRQRVLPLREFGSQPHIDGYADDWPGADQALEFASGDGALVLRVLAGRFGEQVYIYCRVADPTPVRDGLPSAGETGVASDGLQLFLRGARGLVSFVIQTAAPGPLYLSSHTEAGGQMEGYWVDTSDGYQVELALPLSLELEELSIGAMDAQLTPAGKRVVREAGTLSGRQPASWLRFTSDLTGLRTWLTTMIPPNTRAWVVDTGRWVMADTGTASSPAAAGASSAGRSVSFTGSWRDPGPSSRRRVRSGWCASTMPWSTRRSPGSSPGTGPRTRTTRWSATPSPSRSGSTAACRAP